MIFGAIRFSAAVVLTVSGRVIMTEVPKIQFNNGKQYPVIGLGTWKSKPGEVTQAVKDAIDIGYRHFDCAHIYMNEREVGNAIKEKIEEGVITREDIVVTSKLWCTHHNPNDVEQACRISLANLQIEYLDLYLIHWPQAYKDGDELFPKDEEGKVIYSDTDYVDTWKGMEKLVEKSMTISIGVSNFNKSQLERIINFTQIKPVVNQIECHPYLNQDKMFEYCKSQDVVITAYSPLGSPDRPWAKPDEPHLLEDPKIKNIANKHSKTPAQILIRYAIERGMIVIPKSVTKSRIEENFDVFNFKLSEDDMNQIGSLECNGRLCSMGDTDHKDYPFHDEY